MFPCSLKPLGGPQYSNLLCFQAYQVLVKYGLKVLKPTCEASIQFLARWSRENWDESKKLTESGMVG